MKIFEGHKDKPKYFEALNIVRNKIIGSASETLTNYNTVFNFEAIISRLDFTYSDKRPTYIIEQELTVLQQRSLSFEDFCDEVNKKLNAVINKINMSQREKKVAIAMIEDVSAKAPLTFITGLRGYMGQILYAANPKSLPDAYAKLQTIINEQERIKFANQFNQTPVQKFDTGRMNPNFKMKTKPVNETTKYLPMVPSKPTIPLPYRPTDKVTPMEIDKSSMNVNVDQRFKRPLSQRNASQNPNKYQRINTVVDENDLTSTGNSTEQQTEDYCETENEKEDEKNFFFLDESTDYHIHEEPWGLEDLYTS